MPLDPDETADQRARRRELEAAGQLGLPEDALGLDEGEFAEDDEPAGAVTTEGRRVSWRPRPPTVNPKPPTEPRIWASSGPLKAPAPSHFACGAGSSQTRSGLSSRGTG